MLRKDFFCLSFRFFFFFSSLAETKRVSSSSFLCENGCLCIVHFFHASGLVLRKTPQEAFSFPHKRKI